MRRLLIFVIDLVLLNASFVAMKFLRTGTPFQGPPSLRVLHLLINAVWLVLFVFIGAHQVQKSHNRSDLLIRLTRTALLLLLLTSLVIVFKKLLHVSRLQVIGSIAIFGLLQCAVYSRLYPRWEKRIRPAGRPKSGMNFNPRMALTDFAAFLFCFACVYRSARGTLPLDADGTYLLFTLAGLWIVSAEWTYKFKTHPGQGVFHIYERCVKSAVIMAGIAALLIFGFRIFHIPGRIAFGPVLLLLILEFPISLAFHRIAPAGDDERGPDPTRNIEASEAGADGPETDPAESDSPRGPAVNEALRSRYRAFLDLMEQHCRFSKLRTDEIACRDTDDPDGLQMPGGRTLSLFVNFRRVNDIRDPNRYFLKVRESVKNGGCLAGVKDSLESHREKFSARYPPLTANVLYWSDLLFIRILLKQTGVLRLSFIQSRMRNRVISRAELFGRLAFCGFRIVAHRMDGSDLYFIAQKFHRPSTNENPSSGRLIKLERVGYRGQIFNLFKFRTMYPYSEYIQDFVYSQNKLDPSGKIAEDFRITSWGRVFRILWIDELPQLINFIRGDVNLVGVRALSRHFFNLYPEDLRKLRIRFKPGIIPPYYADMPGNFKEIIESEIRYLGKKAAHPWITDVRYFFRAVHNIVFKKARSR
jgi:lipopolysaccharide/colanic/teichoic acid biosynthesis glycosyltransferase